MWPSAKTRPTGKIGLKECSSRGRARGDERGGGAACNRAARTACLAWLFIRVLRTLATRKAEMLSNGANDVVSAAPPRAQTEALLALRASSADGAAYLSATRPFSDRNSRSSYRARATTTLLVNGCGRSGTHALVGLLRRHGVLALHEGHGREATVGWPYVGRLPGSWHQVWPMSNQPHGGDAHDPIFKVHRHPLAAIKSIAAGFTSSGACRNPSERRWDARAWNCATRFVPLPVPRTAIDAQMTCTLDERARLNLALHYWVKWNLLADRWATHRFAVETLTAHDVLKRWCSHCAREHTCVCPASAELALLNFGVDVNGTKIPDATASERQRTTFRQLELAAQLPETWQRQRLKPREQGDGTGETSDAHVRRRKGHGKKKGPPLTWEVLSAVDANLTQVAMLMAKEYGYGMQEPTRSAA